jgi:hypothetical protein
MTTRRAASLLSMVLALTATLTGCIEDKQTVTVEPDGKGTLRLERTLGKQMSEMLLSVAGAGDKLTAVRGVAAQQLSQMSGIAAWTDVEASVTDDQRVRIVATGWFEDVARIETDRQGGKQPLFLVERQGDVVTISMRQNPAAGGGAAEKSFFDRDPAELEMMKGMMKGLVDGMLQGLSIDVFVSAPGAATEATGWTSQEPKESAGAPKAERTTVGYHMDANRVVQLLETMIAGGEELRPKVEAGEMTKEAADAELQRRMSSQSEARLVFKADPARATPDFAGKLAAAVAAWETSPWKAEVEKARESAALGGGLGGPPAEPVPEGLTRETPDGLEPNDSAEAATPVPGPTVLADLLLEEGGEDWFRIDVPKGKELLVAARFDHSKGDIDMELLDAELRTLRTSTSSGNVEKVRVAAAKEARTCLVRLFNGKNPYHLEVTLEDYVPGDAFEPNDGREEAAPVTAGTHEGLASNGEDWYRLEAPAGKLLDVTITFEASQGDLELEVQAASGQPLAESRGMSDQERVRCFAPDEPVLVRVFDQAQNPVKYTLSITIAEPPAKDALEPNDSPSAAKVLEAGKHEKLALESEDWYRLEVAAGKQLRVVARKTDETIPGDVDLTLFAPGATPGEEVELTSARGAYTGQATLFVARPKAGPVLVRVTGGIVPYELEVVEEPFTAEDAFEPNEYRLDARTIPAGKHEKLVCGGDDWYRIELAAGQTLKVVASFTNSEADLDLEVQDLEGNYLGSSAGTEDQEKVEVEADQGKRVVCVHVYCADKTKRSTYTLELTAKKP